jgi:nitroimidazol reductase NimA-like FMN-containing flavoprotein (pyridoxamine 5'-phosphate oxidase superfamily)
MQILMKILNASEPGLGSSMTEDEVINFLSNSKLFARIGTIDEKEDPNVHPVWYYFDNDRIYFETGKNSKKLRNIKRKNNIYFCIDDTNLPYKGVRGKGTAIISNDINRNISIAEKILNKYTGSLDNNMAKFLMDAIVRGESIIIEIIPHFYATWDHSKGNI